MVNVGKLAKDIEEKILETPNDKFVKSPHLNFNDANRLTNDYLLKYGARMDAINPHNPLSSYIVAVPGAKGALEFLKVLDLNIDIKEILVTKIYGVQNA